MEWGCPACEAYNPLALDTCEQCGTPFSARFGSPQDRPAARVHWPAALILSVLLPGAGHVAAGRVGTGLARILLTTVWLAGGVLLLLGGGRTAAAAAVPLLLGVAVVGVGSVLDLMALQRGERELLGGRTLLWLVVGVTLLSALGLAAVLVPATS